MNEVFQNLNPELLPSITLQSLSEGIFNSLKDLLVTVDEHAKN